MIWRDYLFMDKKIWEGEIKNIKTMSHDQSPKSCYLDNFYHKGKQILWTLPKPESWVYIT